MDDIQMFVGDDDDVLCFYKLGYSCIYDSTEKAQNMKRVMQLVLPKLPVLYNCNNAAM